MSADNSQHELVAVMRKSRSYFKIVRLRQAYLPIMFFAVGATSGIGAATARELVSSSTYPKLFIIGQNKTRGVALVQELQALNPRAELHFIQSDLSLIRNVDSVCAQIIEKESKINLLFITMGVLNMSGRDGKHEDSNSRVPLPNSFMHRNI
jgi:NADP-dependent 3-hydroxy acid dehydrogenase YdfG